MTRQGEWPSTMRKLSGLTQEKQQRFAPGLTREMSGWAVDTNTLDNFTGNGRKKESAAFLK